MTQTARRILAIGILGAMAVFAAPISSSAYDCVDSQCWTCIGSEYGANCGWVSASGACTCWDGERTVVLGDGTKITIEICQRALQCLYWPYA